MKLLEATHRTLIFNDLSNSSYGIKLIAASSVVNSEISGKIRLSTNF